MVRMCIHGVDVKYFKCRDCKDIERLDDLKEENDRLRAALTFYADAENYNPHGGYNPKIPRDRGERARAALKGER